MKMPKKCETFMPRWFSKIAIPITLLVLLGLCWLIVPYIGYVTYIGILITVLLIMSISALEKCWTTKRTIIHFAPYIIVSILMILVVVLTSGNSLRMLGMTEGEIEKFGSDLTYGFENFWYQLAVVVSSGGTPTINFTANIIMYAVAAFMMVYGDRMENEIVMVGGTIMLFAPMILTLTFVLITGQPIGLFADFASGFSIFGPAGWIIMAIICVIPDALIISILMTIDRLIPEPGEEVTGA